MIRARTLPVPRFLPGIDIERILLTGEGIEQIEFDTFAMVELAEMWTEARADLVPRWRRDYPREQPWALRYFGPDPTVEGIRQRFKVSERRNDVGQVS